MIFVPKTGSQNVPPGEVGSGGGGGSLNVVGFWGVQTVCAVPEPGDSSKSDRQTNKKIVRFLGRIEARLILCWRVFMIKPSLLRTVRVAVCDAFFALKRVELYRAVTRPVLSS
jgi:hypothetical protein